MPKTTQPRVVRLFKNGRSQAVRIPREFEIPGNEALLRQERGGRLVLEPIRRLTLAERLASWEPLRREDAMPVMEDAPPEAVDL